MGSQKVMNRTFKKLKKLEEEKKTITFSVKEMREKRQKIADEVQRLVNFLNESNQEMQKAQNRILQLQGVLVNLDEQIDAALGRSPLNSSPKPKNEKGS